MFARQREDQAKAERIGLRRHFIGIERHPAYAEAAVNLGIVLQESGDLDAAISAYQTAYRIRPGTFGTIAMALTSAPSGRLWLNEQALRDLLRG